MPLYMITVPGLDVKSDWRVMHDRVLDGFANVDDVLPTTIPETLLIVYRGRAHSDGWLQAMSEGVLFRRMTAGGGRKPPGWPSPVRRLTAHIPNQEGHTA